MEYLAIKNDDELYHKNYKYIDKYKSKSGKYVYVYNKLKKGISDTRKVEAEEDGWKGAYDVSPASFKGSTGGTYSFGADSKSTLKRTKENESGSVNYNVKNGKQLFDTYDETVKITSPSSSNEKNGSVYVERNANITYGYLHRAYNTIESGKKAVEKLLKKYF